MNQDTQCALHIPFLSQASHTPTNAPIPFSDNAPPPSNDSALHDRASHGFPGAISDPYQHPDASSQLRLRRFATRAAWQDGVTNRNQFRSLHNRADGLRYLMIYDYLIYPIGGRPGRQAGWGLLVIEGLNTIL
jgi:hypothetical protein